MPFLKERWLWQARALSGKRELTGSGQCNGYNDCCNPKDDPNKGGDPDSAGRFSELEETYHTEQDGCNGDDHGQDTP